MSESCGEAHKKFSAIFEKLPDGAKRHLLEQHLFPLIDGLPITEKTKLVDVANDARTRFAAMPYLDLMSKRAEVETLMDELRRDSYRSYIPDTSRREELMEEIADTVTSWLSDIWQTGFEYGVDFEKAHVCLLFCCEIFRQVEVTGTGCKCAFKNMYLPVDIKDSRGNIIKHFSYSDAFFLGDALLWIWRDILLRMLLGGRPTERSQIPRMLQDIQSVAQASLDKLLTSGRKIYNNENTDSESEEENDDDTDIHCGKRAAHWTQELMAQLPALRLLIADAKFETFKGSPSYSLYNSIIALAPLKMTPILAYLRKSISYSAEAAVTALGIYSFNEDGESIIETFEVARHIFRPRDSQAMQRAVHVLRHTKHAPQALDIIDRELRDCIETIRGLVLSSAYGGVEEAENLERLEEILNLRQGSDQREEAIESWTDSVETIAPSMGHPLALPGFLIGFPPGFDPQDADEADPLLVFGIKEGHPDYNDLRDEWQPRIKESFLGWIAEAEMLRGGGPALLSEIEKVIHEVMPYTRALDLIAAMAMRLQERQTKAHISDALEGLHNFLTKREKKRILPQREEPTLTPAERIRFERLLDMLADEDENDHLAGSSTQMQSEYTTYDADDAIPGLEDLD